MPPISGRWIARSKSRWTRSTCLTRRCRRDDAFRRRAPSRGVLQNPAQRPDLLLLDEPTNHLDADAVAWLERHLAEYPGTVVAVTHDRYFLDNVAKWILELDRGQGIPWEGNYSSGLSKRKSDWPSKKNRPSPAQDPATRTRMGRMAPRARQAKNKARIKAYDEMSQQQFRERPDEFEIQIPPGKHLGDLVIEADNISKGYGDRQLIENLSFRLPPGGIVGVIGANGAGKTTLFRMITGEEKPDSAPCASDRPWNWAMSTRAAIRSAPKHTVYEEISGGHETLEMGGRKVNARLMSIDSISAGRIRKSWWATCPAESETESTWQNCCDAARTFCCSTSRPTTSTSTRCGHWRKPSSTTPVVSWSSAMIAGSSIDSQRTSWRLKATPMCIGARAITRLRATTKRTAGNFRR